MRFAFNALGFLSVAIFLSTFGAMVGHTRSSFTNAQLAEEPPARPEKATKEMTPDKALAAALKALADAKIKLPGSYKIVMTRTKDKSSWGVWFVGLPETPDMDVYVTVANDGSTSILPGV
jgi:hypothetical protein